MNTLVRCLLLAVSLPLALISCSDSDPSGLGIGSGKSYVQADLSGSLDGKFNAVDGFLGSASGLAFAEIAKKGPDTMIWVQGVELDPNDKENYERFIQIWFLNPKVGTYDSARLCQNAVESEPSSCARVTFYAEDSLTYLESGTVRITSMDKNRIKGTFEGAGKTSWGDDLEKERPTLQIRNGEFDVEILDL